MPMHSQFQSSFSRRILKHAWFLFLTIISVPVIAQGLEKAYIQVEPLQYSRQGVFRGCGFTLLILQDTESAQRDLLTMSLNFWIDTPSFATVKMSLTKASLDPSSKAGPIKLDYCWARIKYGEPLQPLKTLSGDEEAILTIVDISQGIAFFDAVLNGVNEIQFGFKQKGSKYERVFYGRATLAPESKRNLIDCFSEYVTRIQSAVGTPDGKK